MDPNHYKEILDIRKQKFQKQVKIWYQNQKKISLTLI